MLRVKALVTLLSSSLVLAACGQLIGLSDYEEVEGNTSGKGGSSGKGGGSGKGGSSGKGGTAGSSGGASGETGEGGAAAVSGAPAGGTSGDGGTAGESGSSGVGGSAGDAGGEGGASAGSDGGGSGGSDGGTGGSNAGAGGEGGRPPRNCTEITPGTVVVAYDSHEAPAFTTYYTELESSLATNDWDFMALDFYDGGSFDGGDVGTFDLGTPAEAQYSTCSRCILVYEDSSLTSGKLYFQESGTLVVRPGSDQMNGAVDVELQDVTLIEVTINGAVSTPVEDGACVHIQQASLTWEAGPEATWSCFPSWYEDTVCDCGCLVQDPDCSAPTSDACYNDTCWCPSSQLCNAESNWLCDP